MASLLQMYAICLNFKMVVKVMAYTNDYCIATTILKLRWEFIPCYQVNIVSKGGFQCSEKNIQYYCECHVGRYSLRRHRLIGSWIPTINMRWSSDRLRFITGFPIPQDGVFLMNKSPCLMLHHRPVRSVRFK